MIFNGKIIFALGKYESSFKLHLINAKCMQFKAIWLKMIIRGFIGHCGAKEVLLGFAPAKDLYRMSFADVLDEESGHGYQRRFNKRHSLDFRHYIQQSGGTTIPLTFNLRPEMQQYWSLRKDVDEFAVLEINESNPKVLSQVDCQHRLGYLSDLDISLAIMVFLGLDAHEEMAVFNTINAKSKGLSRSITDYHDSKLISGIENKKPELVIAIRLNQDPASAWHKQLDLGGNQASGMQRRASLATMQKAVKRFIKETEILQSSDIETAYNVINGFWSAVSLILPYEWSNPRKHFLTKGIGVYSLTSMAADIYNGARRNEVSCSEAYMIAKLESFLPQFDWTSSGPLKGLGGESGVSEALRLIRSNRFYAVGT